MSGEEFINAFLDPRLLPIVAGMAAVGQCLSPKVKEDSNTGQTSSSSNVDSETVSPVVGPDTQPVIVASVRGGDRGKNKATVSETGSLSKFGSSNYESAPGTAVDDSKMIPDSVVVSDSATQVGADAKLAPKGEQELLRGESALSTSGSRSPASEGGSSGGGNSEGGNSEGGNSEGGNSEGGNSEGGNSEGGSSSIDSTRLREEVVKVEGETRTEVVEHAEKFESAQIKDESHFPSGVSSASREEGSSSGTQAENELEGSLADRASVPSEPPLNLPGWVADFNEDDASEAVPVDSKATEDEGMPAMKRSKVERSESNSPEDSSPGGDRHDFAEAEKIPGGGNQPADVWSGSPTSAMPSGLGFGASPDTSVERQGEVRELKPEREAASVLDSEKPPVTDTTGEGGEAGSSPERLEKSPARPPGWCQVMEQLTQKFSQSASENKDTNRVQSASVPYAKDVDDVPSCSREEAESTQEESKPEPSDSDDGSDSGPVLEADEPPVTFPGVEPEGVGSGSHAQVVPTAINNDTASLPFATGSDLTDCSIGGSALTEDNTSQSKGVRKRQRADSSVRSCEPWGPAVSVGSRSAESYATADLAEDFESSSNPFGSSGSPQGMVEGMDEPRDDPVPTRSYSASGKLSVTVSPKNYGGVNTLTSVSVDKTRSAPSFTVSGNDGRVDDGGRPLAENLIAPRSTVREDEGRVDDDGRRLEGLPSIEERSEEGLPNIEERSEDTGNSRSSTDEEVERRVEDDDKSVAETRSAPSASDRENDGRVDDGGRPIPDSLFTPSSTVRENERRVQDGGGRVEERSEDTGNSQTSTDGGVEGRVEDDGKRVAESPIIEERSEDTGNSRSSTDGEVERRVEEDGKSVAETRSAPSASDRENDGRVDDGGRPIPDSLFSPSSTVRENEGRVQDDGGRVEERSEDTGNSQTSTDGEVEGRVEDDGKRVAESPSIEERSEDPGNSRSSTDGEVARRVDDDGKRVAESPSIEKRSEGTDSSRGSTDGKIEERVDADGRRVEESSILEKRSEDTGSSRRSPDGEIEERVDGDERSRLHMEGLRRIGGLMNYSGETDTFMGSESHKPYKRCISALLRGFLVGTGLQGAFSLISILDRLRRRAAKRSTAGLKPIEDSVIAGVKESLRYGMFVGTYAGSFCTVDEVLAAAFGGPSAKWRKLVAGAVAGPSLLLIGSENTSLALYILVKAAVLAARAGIWSSNLGWLCRPLTWRHGDTFLMCLSSSQILWSWIMKPNSLPSSYVSFINKLGNKHPSIVKGIQEIALKQRPLPSLPEIRDHYLLEGSDVDLDPHMEIPCTIIHGSRSCLAHGLSYFLGAYMRAIPVYIPVHIVGSLFLHRANLFRRGTRLMFLKKLSLGIARSSLFLAAYAASAWLWTCGLFRATGTCTPALVAAGTFPTGLALLLEQKSRRMDISIFCLSRALESFALSVSDSKFARRHNLNTPKRFDVVLFSLGAAIIMHCYGMPDPQGKIIRPKYRNVLNWVLGSGSMQWVFDQPCFRQVFAHYFPPPRQSHLPR